MNHNFTLDMAAALAERIRSELPANRPSPHEQVESRILNFAYARTPTDDETAACAGTCRTVRLAGAVPRAVELERIHLS